MAKYITKTLKILGIILGSILTIFLVGCMLLQLPSIQTKVTSNVLEQLSGKFQGNISIGKLYLKPFTTLVIRDATVTDRNPFTNPAYPEKLPVDTLASISDLTVKFSLKGLFKNEGIVIDKVRIDGGEFNLVIENDQQDNLSRIFGLTPNKKKPAEKEVFRIHDIAVNDFRFRMKNHRDFQTQLVPGGIDWNDVDVDSINVVAEEMYFSHGIMYANVPLLEGKEKSGFTIARMCGDVSVGKGKASIKDISFSDGNSDLQLAEYRMEYENVKSFKDYIHLVTMFVDVEEGDLDFKTISYFAPNMDKCRTRWKIRGTAHGTVDDLETEGLSIQSLSGDFSGRIAGRITGLPEISSTRVDARLSSFRMTSAGLEDFINRWSPDSRLEISDYAAGIPWFVSGSVNGRFNDFRSRLYAVSGWGRASADARITNVMAPERGIGIEGTVKTKDLNIGRIIGEDLIGPCTFEANLDTRFNQKEKGTSLHVNSLTVDRLNLNGYDYSNLIALGTLTSQSFNGKIISHDPALNFLFQGTFAFSPRTQNALYSFYLNAGIVDLNKMNIDSRGKSKLQFQTMANFKKTNDGNMTGDVQITDLVMENSKGKRNVGDISLSSLTKGTDYSIGLNSSFADAEYTGTAPIYRFFTDLLATTLGKELPSLFKEKHDFKHGNTYKLDVDFHDSMELFSYLMPGFYIADSTSMKASIDPEGYFHMSVKSPRIAWNEHYIRNARMDVSNISGGLSGEISTTEFKAATFILKENRLKIQAGEDHIGLGYTYNNEGELTNRGEIYALGNISRTDAGNLGIDVDIIPSKVYLNSRAWSILPSKLSYADHNFRADNVEFRSGDQGLNINGGLSGSKADTLGINLERVDISILNPLTGMDLGIGGRATGSARIISPLSDIGILADILCDSTTMSHEQLGTMKAQCKWNEEFKRFDFNCSNLLENTKNLDIAGNYSPAANHLEATMDLDRLKVRYASVFLNTIFDKLDGTVSGRITAEGPPSKLNIRSEGTRLDDGILKIAFTNVPYRIDGEFDMDEYGVHFKDMKVHDRFDAEAILGGSMYYDHFWDLGFDLRLKAHQLEAINLNEKQNEYFYGQVFASGNISLKGPLTDMLLDIDAVTTKPGNLHIPLNSTSEAGGTNLLTFKEPEKKVHIDPYELMMERYKKEKKRETNFDVKMKVSATNDVEAFIEIEKETGNVLSGRGNGVITLDIRPSRDIFDLNGDYTIETGKYHFVAMGLASRDFTIKEGSTVHFNGDIMNTTLDIDANYRTKASLSTLIDDQNSVGNRRNIDCGIEITDKMMSPRLKFSIDVPDLDPTIKSRVENALSTEDKIQKQFLSLIISNNFLPDEQSGIINNSSLLYSNVSEIMTNQINNIFEKLNIPLDLGLNYQPNDKGTDIFDVALSTQLFNNRVTVNGSVGNKQNKMGSASNDVVGDLDIEIKLDKKGGWRVNLFSHSADQYTNFLDNTQRNGVGITWQQEFNSFGKYFRTLFMNKEKRRAAKLEEENAMIDGGQVNVRIDEETYKQDKQNRKAEKAKIRQQRKAEKAAKKKAAAEHKKNRHDRKQR